MKIAIFGSWSRDRKRWGLRGSKQEFTEACSSIGRKLAHYGHSIIVGSSSPNTADRYVVNGVIEEAKNANVRFPLIRVLRPDDEWRPFDELAGKYPHLFNFRPRTQEWWQGAHLVGVGEADAILTIGGGGGTYLVGLASIIAKKTLVPIGSFGGTSEKLLNILDNTVEIESKEDFGGLRLPWGEFTLGIALKLIGVLDFPKIFIIHGRSNEWTVLRDWLQKDLKLSKIMVMEQEFGGSKTLPEKLEYVASRVDAAIAVVTPDDIGALKSKKHLGCKPRARQNVWLEVGWFWGRLGRSRIMILCRGEMEIPSDLQGIELYHYQEKPTEKGEQIRLFIEELKAL